MNAPTFAFEAIGTQWKIDVPGLPPEARADLLAEIEERIARFDRAYSRFRDDSLVADMARKAGTYRLPDDAAPMVGLYERLYRLTDGAVTPLIGQALVDAGYDAGYSLVQKKPLEHPPAWADVLSFDAPHLTLKKPALLDFGSVGKGYLIDLVGEILTRRGLKLFTINAGGDILYVDAHKTPLRVGLEHPDDAAQVIGVATITGGSICGSAGNRRAWGEFHHILDPRTLMSPKHILAAWAVAGSATVADALATCLFFVPPETLAKEFPFEYLIVNADYSCQASPGFPAEVFVK